MSEWLQPLLDWVAQHPTWTGVLIFLVAMSESLVLLGLLVPGVVLLFGIGTLVGAGAYPLGHSIAWAAAGAICGDGVSFWLGRYYHEQLRELRPLRRYAQLLTRGEEFFNRHGGKSVLIGRFVGPIRPVIPAIAGMLGMSVSRFLFINVLSALLWAPVYLLPGVVFGASLGLASQVAARLVLLLLGLLLLVGLVLWLSRRCYLLLAPRANRMIDQLLHWGHRHPRFHGVTAALADPAHPEARGLFVAAVLLILLLWAFVALLVLVLGEGAFGLNSAVFNIALGLRTPWMDRLMVIITQLGGGVVTLSLSLVVTLWLVWRRYWFACGHWCAAIVFGAVVPVLLKPALQLPRPLNIYEGAMSFGFPSWHVTMSTVLYGFLAVLISREMSPARRWWIYAAAAIMVSLIGLSRLYLGVHWLTDVIGALVLGLAWVVMLGLAYRRHVTVTIAKRPLLVLILMSLLIAGGWQGSRQLDAQVARYAPHYEILAFNSQGWWENAWQQLPAYRVDLEGDVKQPLTLQWLADAPMIRTQLLKYGWREPMAFDIRGALRWLLPEPTLAELPLLPQVHKGRHDVIHLVHEGGGENRQVVLRLWRADVTMSDSDAPLWLGYLSYQRLERSLPLFALVRTETSFEEPLQLLESALQESHWRHREVTRTQRNLIPDIQWQGTVVLIKNRQDS